MLYPLSNREVVNRFQKDQTCFRKYGESVTRIAESQEMTHMVTVSGMKKQSRAF